MRNLHVKMLALVLVTIGVSLCWYKVTRLGLPLLPTEQAEVWTVEARIEFKAKRDTPVKVHFSIPRSPVGYTVVDENFVSSNYGLTTEDDGTQRFAEWAVRRVKGYQVLYYRINLARDPMAAAPPTITSAPEVQVPEFPELMRSAAQAVLDEVRSKSADAVTFARELLLRLNAPTPDPNVVLLRQNIQVSEDWVRRIVNLLAAANIPARMTHVLILRDGISHGALTPWLEVFDGAGWLPFGPETGEAGFPKEAIVWHMGDSPVLEVSGANMPKSNTLCESTLRI